MLESTLNQTVLVTGGAGFIGRALVSRLQEAGADVSVLDLLDAKVHGPDAGPPADLGDVRFHRADVRDAVAMAAVIDGADVVVHLASETGVGESMYDVRRHVDVNATGTATLMEAIAQADRRPQRVVLSSSRAVYGEGAYDCATCGAVTPHGRALGDLAVGAWEPPCPTCGGTCRSIPTAEPTPLAPASVYGATKVLQEHLMHTVLPAYDVESVCLRYFNVYGPGQSLANPYTGILSTFVERARAGAPIEVYEDGAESRDFVYIDDVVAATRLAITTPAAAGQTLNVGSGTATTLLDLAQAVAALVGSTAAAEVSGAYRAGDIRHATADITRAATVLGHRSETPLATGLAHWVEWAMAGAPNTTDVVARARAELVARGLYRLAR